MLDEGEIAAVVIVGAEFSTSTPVLEFAVDPEVSVAVAVHVTVAPTLASEAETV